MNESPPGAENSSAAPNESGCAKLKTNCTANYSITACCDLQAGGRNE